MEASLSALVDSPTLRRPYWALKRVFDATAAALLALLLAPAIAFVSALVLLDVGRPLLFWQLRPGALGRPFKLYKFRTMRPAHDREGRPVPDAERVSAVGRLLRRTRLDELPQLVQILTGEMSFVGPRPLLAADQAPEHAERLAVRPGLTGWAQVNGGRNVSPADKAALDIWYVHNASFGLDLLVAFRTIRMILLGERPNADALREAWRFLGRGAARSGAVALGGGPERRAA
jgi:lipopolysaccharide/colanic/teichoic acid biosynthesis glycosyltransferase